MADYTTVTEMHFPPRKCSECGAPLSMGISFLGYQCLKGHRTDYYGIAEIKEPQMLPKDLMESLEKGDRTKDFLKTEETERSEREQESIDSLREWAISQRGQWSLQRVELDRMREIEKANQQLARQAASMNNRAQAFYDYGSFDPLSANNMVSTNSVVIDPKTSTIKKREGVKKWTEKMKRML